MRRAASQDVQEHCGQHHQPAGDNSQRRVREAGEAYGDSQRLDGRYVRHQVSGGP